MTAKPDLTAAPRMYAELAHWWPLLSPPSHYIDEAAHLGDLLRTATDVTITMLELGSGGGSLAHHFKKEFRLTLTDVSERMLDVSRAVNPECEHLHGDMRMLRLNRTFDLVLIHDAIMYMTDEQSLREALATARIHCRPGGGAVFVPDHVRETFEPTTDHGGEDGADGRALRYLEWTWDPDPADTTFESVYTFVLRETDGSMRAELDRHQFGLFPRAVWLDWLRQAGFNPHVVRDPWGRDVFVAGAEN